MIELTETYIAKRLTAIARYWQRRFKMAYEMLGDIINEAWAQWLRQAHVDDTESRFNMVSRDVRCFVVRELWGRVPHDLKKTPRPQFSDLSAIRDDHRDHVRPDYIGRVQIREIIDAAKRPYRVTVKREQTLRMIWDLESKDSITPNAFSCRVVDIRKFLVKEGLAT